MTGPWFWTRDGLRCALPCVALGVTDATAASFDITDGPAACADAGIKRLHVAPDGDLYLLPFAAQLEAMAAPRGSPALRGQIWVHFVFVGP